MYHTKEIECLVCGESATYTGTTEEVNAMATEFRSGHLHEVPPGDKEALRRRFQELIALANILGYEDDVKHWTAELDKLEGK